MSLEFQKSVLLILIVILLTFPGCKSDNEKEPIKTREVSKLYPLTLYKGPLKIQYISGEIELFREKEPKTFLKLGVLNDSKYAQDFLIGLYGSMPIKSNVEIHKMKELAVTPKIKRSGRHQGIQSVLINLMPVINSMPVAERIDKVDIKILLPEDVPDLIRSNIPMDKVQMKKRIEYHLKKESFYLTELLLVYTLNPVTLTIEKQITPEIINEAGPIEVTLSIQNVGNADAQNVLLEDNFDPRDFSGEGDQFQQYVGQENDRRLLWSRIIDNIPAGSSITVAYTVNALMPVHSVSLSPVTARINNELVGISNKIKLNPLRTKYKN